MSKKVNNVESKSKKKTEAPVPPTEEVIVETVEDAPAVSPKDMTPGNMVGTTQSSLDANHRIDLLHLADDIFRKDPDAVKRFGLETVESVNTIVAKGVVSSLVDEAMFGNGIFTAVLRSTAYPQLVLAAHDMGIKLPDLKALPAGKTPGTIELPSTEIKPSAETKKQMKEEHAIETSGNKGEIELDPKKVAELGDEESLKKALSYILITGPKKQRNIKDTLTATVDFMREYRMALADKAAKPADAKDALDSRSVREWLNDAFSYVKPTHLLSGIGRGMVNLVEEEDCVVSAFLILRNSLMEKDSTTPVWDDQSIADATAAIIEMFCKDSIAKEKEALAKVDTKSKDYKTVKAGYEKSITRYEEIIVKVCNPDFVMIDNLENLVPTDNAVALKMVGRIRSQFYPETKGKDASDYKNLIPNLIQRAGIINNMFREAGNSNQNYNESNLTDLVEFTEEEKVELRKKAAEANKKPTEKSEESKNS